MPRLAVFLFLGFALLVQVPVHGQVPKREKISKTVRQNRLEKQRPPGRSMAEHRRMLRDRGLNDQALDAEECALYSVQPLTPAEIAELARQGVRVYADLWVPPVPGKHPLGFHLASVDYESLPAVEADVRIEFLESVEFQLHPKNDLGRTMINLDDVQNGAGVTARNGTGVKIAIADSGFDLTHPDLPVPVETYDVSDGVGVANWGTNVANTASPHGTHVAGTAVGSGGLSGGKYKGGAPGASVYLYKIGNDTDARASYADMIEAINRAASRGVKIFTMSYGGLSTYMDGSESVEQAIDAAVAGGMAVFISAGNDADDMAHDSVSVAPGATSSGLGFSVTNPSGTSAYTTPVDIRVIWRDGTPSDANVVLACTNLGGGETLSQTFSSWSSRGTDAKIYRLVPNLAASATKTYTFTVQNTAASGSTPLVHLYRSTDTGTFTSPDASYTVGTPALADSAIAVGAWTQRRNWTNYTGGSWQYSALTVGTLAPFSSQGPRIDGVRKPDLVAPGAATISARESVGTLASTSSLIIDNDGLNLNGSGPANYYVMQGTSMACPLAAGAAALVLENNPGLNPADLKNALTSTASLAGSPNNQVGHGLIDVLAAVVATDSQIRITSVNAVTGFAHQSFSHQITTSRPATGFSSDPLPAGLNLNPATGLISGIPTSGGEFVVQVSATNGSTSDVQSLTITISDPDIAVYRREGTPLSSGVSAVDFGDAFPNARQSLRLAIRNEGSTTLTLGTPFVSGPQAGRFLPGTPSSSSLLPQATAYLDIQFAPISTGPHAGDLHLPSNDVDTPDFVVSLLGNGLNAGGGVNLVSDLNVAIAGLNASNVTSMGTYILFYADTPLHGLELWRSDGTAAGTYLLKDIYPGTSGTFNPAIYRAGNLAYFAATSPTEGTELWVTDGTPDGTVMVKDINTGLGSSAPSQFALIGSTLYFRALTNTTGFELWKTDGTAAGTVMVAEINPGSSNSNPGGFTLVNGVVVFTATNAASGLELWKTDGTPGGTQLLLDINAGTASGSPSGLFSMGNTVYFSATNPAGGNELWKTDGTAPGTQMVKDIQPGTGGSSPFGLVERDGILYFRATTTAAGFELWRSDGSDAGTYLVKDINTGTSSSSPSGLVVFNNRLYFSASTSATGSELWTSDGTDAGTSLVADLQPGTSSSSPLNFFAAGGSLYFSASNGLGRELWRTDGTGGGTVQVKDIWPGSFSSNPTQLVEHNGLLLFSANDGGTGSELWRSDGTNAGTYPVGDLITGSDSGNFGHLRNIDGTLYFSGDAGTTGLELWKSSGSAATTVLVKDILSGSLGSTPANMTQVGTKLVFAGILTANGTELMVSDGTSGGTGLLADLIAGSTSSAPGNFFPLGSDALFTASNGSLGTELWKTDGTLAGTAMVADIFTGSSGSSPFGFANFKGKAVFRATDATSGTELWISDGSASGTRRIKDINPGGTSSTPQGFAVMNGEFYFSATTATEGAEVWKSDGTEAGTMQLASIFEGTTSSSPSSLTAIGSTLYFAAASSGIGGELWKSDGTTEGTTLVRDIREGTLSSVPALFTELAGLVYFTADDGVNGRELWQTDGTAGGTVLLKDILPGAGGSAPSLFVRMGGRIYFTADDGVHGRELWMTDGTTEGTVMVTDLNPGEAGSQPNTLTAVGPRLYFTAVHPTTGMELFHVVEDLPARLRASYPAGTTLTSGTSSLDVGIVPVGSSRALTLTLENRGTNRLAISGHSITGPDAAEFEAGSLSQAVLFGNDRATLDVVYTPATVGAKSALLHLYSDDPTTPEYTIALEAPKIDQTITFAPISDRLTTDTVVLSATGGASGNPVTFAVTSGPGVIAGGNSLTFTGAGAVTVSASQAGNEDYHAAAGVARTFTVSKAPAAVNLTGLSQTYDGTPRAVGATTTPGGLNVVFTYDGLGVVPTGAGTYEVGAVIDDAIYEGGTTATLVVAKASQTITFAQISGQLATATVSLSATGGGSGLPVTFAVTGGPGIITGGNSLSFTGAGEVTVTASQAGNENYFAAPGVPQSFAVTKAPATVELTGLNQTYNGGPREVIATTDPAGLSVSLTYDGFAAIPTGPGTYEVTATVNEARYEGSAVATLSVAKAGQTIVFPVIPDQLANATVNLSAIGGASGHPVTFSVTGGPGVITGGNSLAFTGAGEVTITASQAGNDNYLAAADVARSFEVTLASASVTLSDLNQVFDGSPREVTVTTVPADLEVEVTYDGDSPAPVSIGTYAVAVAITNPLYEGAAAGTLIVDDPAGMALIEGGSLPALSVLGPLDAATFEMARYETTWAYWSEVRDWAAANGYDLASVGEGCAGDHPVRSLSWFDALKWCNARTEWENAMSNRSLAPAYTVAGSVYRTGEPSPASIRLDRFTSGYRLPSAREWEFAARGGISGTLQTYPGGEVLEPLGWYAGNSFGAICDLSEGRGTWPAGRKASIHPGLHDLAGNIAEWTGETDPGELSHLLAAGGSWNTNAAACALGALRGELPAVRLSDLGFRVARSVADAMAGALDAESLSWRTGGEVPWIAQTGTTFDQLDAAESGRIGENGSSWIETSVTGPGNLRFRWKADLAGSAALRFTMGGEERLLVASSSDWTEYHVETPDGTTGLRWTFVRGAGGEAEGSSVWIDAVVHTLAVPPVLTTLPASEITASTAATGGEVTDEGGRAVTARGIVWSGDPDPEVGIAPSLESGTGAGPFEISLSGLSPGTTYFVRAFGTNAIGTGYGPNAYFTTDETVDLVDGVASRSRTILSGDRQVIHFTLAGPRFVSLSTVGGASLRAELYNGAGELVASFDGDTDLDLDRLLLAGDYSLHLFRMPGAGPAQNFDLTVDASVVAFPRPDLAVGASESSLVGVGIHSGAVGQQINRISSKARPVIALVTVANSGNLPDSISLRASPGNAFFGLSYSGPEGNLTAALVAGTYRTPEIDEADSPIRLNAVFVPNKKKLKKTRGKRTIYLKKTIVSNVVATSTFDPGAGDAAVIQVQTK